MLRLLAQTPAAAALASALIGMSKSRPYCGCRHTQAEAAAAAGTKSGSPESSTGGVPPTSPPGQLEQQAEQHSKNAGKLCIQCVRMLLDKLCGVLPLMASLVSAVYNTALPSPEASSNSSSGSSSSVTPQVAASAALLMLAVTRSCATVLTAVLAAAAAAGTAVEGLVDAVDNQSRAEAGSPAAAATAEQQPGVDDGRATAETLISQQLHQKTLLRLAVNMSGAALAAVELPQHRVQQQAQAGAVAWPHLLQLHAVPELVSAVERLQEVCKQLQQQNVATASSSGGPADSCGSSFGGSATADSSRYSSSKDSNSSSSVDTSLASHAQDNGPALQLLQRADAASRSSTVDLVSELLSFCNVAAAAVPLPEVCNNPGCSSLEGISEAAAAVKACVACGTRYCCRQCQQAHWKQHKPACKRLRSSAGAAASAAMSCTQS
jgi:hypothetical protein